MKKREFEPLDQKVEVQKPSRLFSLLYHIIDYRYRLERGNLSIFKNLIVHRPFYDRFYKHMCVFDISMIKEVKLVFKLNTMVF